MDKIECFPCHESDTIKILTKEKMERHSGVHKRSHPYQCQQCFNRFRLKDIKISHMLLVHDTVEEADAEAAIVCLPCREESKNEKVRTKQDMERHASMHKNTHPKQCPTCFNRFRSKGGKAAHISAVHGP